MPRSQEEFDALFTTLMRYFGVPDQDDARMMISGQITGRPATTASIRYDHLANAAKRLQLNLVAHTEGIRARERLIARHQAAFDAEKAQNPTKESDQTDVPETVVPADTGE